MKMLLKNVYISTTKYISTYIPTFNRESMYFINIKL